MPCARPRNIAKLAPGYLEKIDPHPFELRWHITCQGPEPDPKGVQKCNEALDEISSGWVMFPADDTEQHPALYRRLHETVMANPQAGAVVFNQDRHIGMTILQARPENMRPCHVCGGQIAWKREFLGDERFNYSRDGGTCDGVLIQKMYDRHPDRFVFVPETLTKFGSLEWT